MKSPQVNEPRKKTSSLSKELVQAYNAARTSKSQKYLCHAPFNNIYFNMMGQGAPCWLTLQNAPTYPEKSVREIWFGDRYNQMRTNIKKNDLSGPCHVCERNIKNKVFRSALANAYDTQFPITDYPSIMEFELSNICNLECTMCKGILSSTIRRDRDKLPRLKAPYDQAFVEQLKEFLPHLKEARFNGGEPLLQKICWDIWEQIAKINPEIEITLATNGTTLNDKAKKLFERCKFRVNVSIDSLDKKTYESIRKNAQFETVMENLKWYAAYCKLMDTNLSIMVNPMRVNWWDMPNFVRFCAQNQYWLWFNTIWRPPHLALWNMESSELQKIYDHLALEADKLSKDPIDSPTFYSALEVFQNLVHGQIKTWIQEQKVREKEGRDYETSEKQKELSKELFFQKLDTHLAKENLTGLKDDLKEKISSLEDMVKGNVPSRDYYSILLGQPMEMVLDDLKNKSAQVLTEWVYCHDGYY